MKHNYLSNVFVRLLVFPFFSHYVGLYCYGTTCLCFGYRRKFNLYITRYILHETPKAALISQFYITVEKMYLNIQKAIGECDCLVSFQYLPGILILFAKIDLGYNSCKQQKYCEFDVVFLFTAVANHSP